MCDTRHILGKWIALLDQRLDAFVFSAHVTCIVIGLPSAIAYVDFVILREAGEAASKLLASVTTHLKKREKSLNRTFINDIPEHARELVNMPDVRRRIK